MIKYVVGIDATVGIYFSLALWDNRHEFVSGMLCAIVAITFFGWALENAKEYMAR